MRVRVSVARAGSPARSNGAQTPPGSSQKIRPTVSKDGKSLRVRVPIKLRQYGGRKLVVTPDGANVAPIPFLPSGDTTLVKAIARAFRWRKLLETGRYSTIEDLSSSEKINPSYVSRVLRLTLLSPIIVETILGGQQDRMRVEDLLAPLPAEWQKQVRHLVSRK